MAYKLFIEESDIVNLKPSTCRRSSRLNRTAKFELPSFNIDAARRSFDYHAPLVLNEACEVLNIDISEPMERDDVVVFSENS